ncbi:MAG TPA: hypothetical protein VFW55_02200 [Propionicimonas sp.]|nr:hypothetical protein [Propionicimonas sp.]
MAHRNLRLGRWILGAVAAAFVVVGVWGYLRAVKFETLTTAGRVYASSGLQSLVTPLSEDLLLDVTVAPDKVPR